MRAIICDRYGPPEILRIEDVERPVPVLKEDFTKNGETYDVVFDAVGKPSFRRSRRSLKPGGKYLPTDGFTNCSGPRGRGGSATGVW